ncbi:angio-associated migratory cell protein-like protein [Tanacetum coccineum]
MLHRGQVEHVKAERNLLAEVDINCIVKLYCSFQYTKYLYLVMEYLPGFQVSTTFSNHLPFLHDVNADNETLKLLGCYYYCSSIEATEEAMEEFRSAVKEVCAIAVPSIVIFKGIPKAAEVPPVARVPLVPAVNPLLQALQDTQPAAAPPSGPNANPLNLFSQACCLSSGLPDMGGNAPVGAIVRAVDRIVHMSLFISTTDVPLFAKNVSSSLSTGENQQARESQDKTRSDNVEDDVLYPLENTFFFLPKPPTLILHDEVIILGFSRKEQKELDVAKLLYTVACIPTDAQLVATRAGDDKGFLWKIGQGDWAFELQGHKETVSCVAFSSDGHLVASGSLDGVIQAWDISLGNVKYMLDGPAAGIEIAQACRPVVKGLGMWGSIKALGRGYEYLIGVMIFTHVAILAWWTFDVRHKVDNNIQLEDVHNETEPSALTLWCVQANLSKAMEQAKDSSSEIKKLNNILQELQSLGVGAHLVNLCNVTEVAASLFFYA